MERPDEYPDGIQICSSFQKLAFFGCAWREGHYWAAPTFASSKSSADGLSFGRSVSDFSLEIFVMLHNANEGEFSERTGDSQCDARYTACSGSVMIRPGVQLESLSWKVVTNGEFVECWGSGLGSRRKHGVYLLFSKQAPAGSKQSKQL